MMPNLSRILLTLLPLAGLAALWAWSDVQSRQGVEWDVPIEGYDPRDLLRGHYVEFTYNWPGLQDDEFGPPQTLCLFGTAPSIANVTPMLDRTDNCENMAIANMGGVYGPDSLVRGRLYVEQDRALELEERLLDRSQQGFVRIRLRADGVLTPLDIRFEPAPEERAVTVPVEVEQP